MAQRVHDDITAGSVSVIIPTYNALKHIDECLASLLAQELMPLEIIFIDDGSQDGTLERLYQYQAEHGDLIKVLHHDQYANKGIPTTRNLGIQHARGEYIALIDQDDVWAPGRLARQVPVMDKDRSIFVCHGHVRFIDGESNIIQNQIFDIGGRGKPNMFPRLLIENNMATCSALIRSDRLIEVGMFPTNQFYFEDWLLWLKLSLKGRFHLIEEVLAYYRIHSGSTMEKLKADDRALSNEITMIINFYTFAEEKALISPFPRFVYRKFSIGRAYFRAHSLGIARSHMQSEALRLQQSFPGERIYIQSIIGLLTLVPRQLSGSFRRVWRLLMKA